MSIKISLLFIVFALLCTNCEQTSGRVDTDAKVRQYALTDLDKRIVQASNAFGLQLYREVSRSQEGENVFLSPLSISSALAIVYNGAEGNTREAMAKTLGLSEIAREDSSHGYRVLLDLLNHPTDSGVELSVANSIWKRQGNLFHEKFLQQSRTDFNAEVSELDFKSSKSVDTMNNWVKQQTNGKIQDIVEEINPLTMLYVLNAVYFDGVWTVPFLPDSTTKGQFHISPSDVVSVDMMSGGGHFEYVKEAGYEAIKLPFGKQESTSMVILLPEEGAEGLHHLRERLVNDPTLITKPYDVQQGGMQMPKVNFEYDVDLNEMLQALGMSEAYDRVHADFSGMAPEPPNLFIGDVRHKTFLDINEQGTTAAAATKVEMLAGSAPPMDPFQMKIDRPFILSIVDKDTGSILFVGTVVNPKG